MNRDLETLSAFFDGETSELESRRVMRDLDDDSLAAMSRWQLARDVLHGQASQPVPDGFNASLAAALAEEPVPAKRPVWMGSVARLAVAASVAAATVVGWYSWEGTSLGGADQVATTESRMSRPFGETSLVAQSLSDSASASPAAVKVNQPRVNAMLLRHSEMAARHNGQAVMPYARLVSMDARHGAR